MRHGTAAYANGQGTVRRILEASRHLLVEEGYQNFTMRRVARELGISIGNLSYYYASRADLITDLLQHVIDGYLRQFDMLRENAGDDADQQFRAVLSFVYDDLSSRQTTLFFPELWVLANRDAGVADQMESLYAQYREILKDVIGLMNPKLSAAKRADLALLISASLEGLTIFIGHQRPHSSRAAQLRTPTIENFVNLVKTSEG